LGGVRVTVRCRVRCRAHGAPRHWFCRRGPSHTPATA